MKMLPSILAVPGFLGLQSDWDFLKSEQVTAIDYELFSWNSLTDWGAQLNQWIIQQEKSPSILIGYSLGGRLALHAILDNPKQWKGAVIISAHPGLSDNLDRAKRLENDSKWAERFEKDEWSSLMNSWNQQETFSHDPQTFERREKDYKRTQLIHTLLKGSLSTQDDLRHPISQLKIPILWITGSKDHRFSSLAESLSFKHPLSQWIKVEGAGHRVPWSHPAVFKNLLGNFFEKF